ncbi:alpha-L-arabinofuranosidase C-terminal domain-containing protein [Synoicihabitans lomoniglobus]|uniref:non-reducing end alpha-L-arabinofuranosidase n=1 Tax=Synoicihabitans lomoniglobus TaxID=2909285 RepID=A0AAE9ZV94_9BACT|nr:alpha-N-arabinofuranosidase [Opitutaceae bacterium LMO-M01]WED63113.1 alpha-L-arabinofuranosidase C-terminal domain-containing protein [Opitutaceae bacterium LMO-M01]
MKALLFAPLVLSGVVAFSASPTARITIDIDDVIDQIDPRIYGVFMEPIGFNRPEMKFNTLYGPLYAPDAEDADENGWRTGMLDAARELQFTNMRWPGGNFLGSYDWRDGVGPKAERPKRMELAWGVVEPNLVGTDEWVQLNALLGTENVVAINMGTGSIDDARYWVEYCNAPTGTYWADKRAEYGHPEPFGIKYWCLGNEVDGEGWIIGYKNAEDYVKFARVVSRAMKRSSPGTELSFVANGSSNYQDTLAWIDWNWTVIKGTHDIADFISLHRYWDNSDDYYTFIGERAVDLQEKIDITVGQIKAVSTTVKEPPLYISFDEWAPPFRGGHWSTLALAQFFNAFIRNADYIKMANYTLLTSILARDPETDATYKTPTFYAFKAYSTRNHGDALRTSVVCDTFGVDDYYTAIPYLDVTSVHNRKSGEVFINVVNRHQDEAIATAIRSVVGTFAPTARVSSITTDDTDNRPYTYADRDTYRPTATEIPTDNDTITYRFPAHSFTQIIVKVDRD